MLRAVAIFSFACLAISSASAQMIYEPVRYQYGGARPYYYGGSDPAMFRFANDYPTRGKTFGRVNGFAWVNANIMAHREVTDEPLRAYTDSMPRNNAAIYGYNADNARNEAYANAPRYFRMRDVMAFAVPDESGALRVPAQLPTTSDGSVIEIKPFVRKPRTGVSTGAIIIIPKKMSAKSPQLQVAARD